MPCLHDHSKGFAYPEVNMPCLHDHPKGFAYPHVNISHDHPQGFAYPQVNMPCSHDHSKSTCLACMTIPKAFPIYRSKCPAHMITSSLPVVYNTSVKGVSFPTHDLHLIYTYTSFEQLSFPCSIPHQCNKLCPLIPHNASLILSIPPSIPTTTTIASYSFLPLSLSSFMLVAIFIIIINSSLLYHSHLSYSTPLLNINLWSARGWPCLLLSHTCPWVVSRGWGNCGFQG